MTELDDWQILLGLFPSEWRQLGRSSGAVRRLRGFPSLDALLRTLLLHVGCGWSLRETAVQAKLAGIAEVSDVTLLNRLRDAESWLRQMCQELWKDNGVELQPSFGSRTVRLLDATVVHAGVRPLRSDLNARRWCCRTLRTVSLSGWRTGACRCGLLPSCWYRCGGGREGRRVCAPQPAWIAHIR